MNKTLYLTLQPICLSMAMNNDNDYNNPCNKNNDNPK